jgi:hypothetical protein
MNAIIMNINPTIKRNRNNERIKISVQKKIEAINPNNMIC